MPCPKTGRMTVSVVCFFRREHLETCGAHDNISGLLRQDDGAGRALRASAVRCVWRDVLEIWSIGEMKVLRTPLSAVSQRRERNV